MLSMLSTVKQTPKQNLKEKILHEFAKYNIAYLIRGHSKDGSSHDSMTQVNDVAFELALSPSSDLNVLPKYTNLCATCGLNIVNIIDTNSGRIVKRYNDETMLRGTKEAIYSKC